MAILKQLDDTPLKFGKHRGETPSEIAEDDPGYIIWAYENIEQKPCTQHLYKKCLKEREDHSRSRAMAYIYTDYDCDDDIGDGSWSGRGWGD